MMDKDIKILTLNCRGLNNIVEMKKLFQWLIDNKYDVICLQETFCTDKLKPIFDSCWPGKTIHALSDSSHSRGVSILFNEKFNCNIINSHVSNDGRQVLTNVKVEDRKELTILSVYAPNDEKGRKVFYKKMTKWVMQHSLNTENLILCGDLNCCINDEDRIPRTHLKDTSRIALRNMLKFCKLIDVWDVYCKNKQCRYTYCNNTCKSRIDYIMMSEKCSF